MPLRQLPNCVPPIVQKTELPELPANFTSLVSDRAWNMRMPL